MNGISREGAPIGVGVLGCGTIGPLHAAASRELSGARLVAVADLRPERAAALGAQYEVAAFTSLDELLECPGVELVCVCTPSGTHGALGTEIARAGRHVVLEKPIDVDLGSADKVMAACRDAGVVLSVISQHRFDSGLIALHEASRSGRLGRLRLAEGRAWWYRTQGYYDSANWRGTERLDGGALANQGVHLVDLLLWLFGPATSVFARRATVAHEMESEDVLVATLELADGMLGVLSVTTASYPGTPETLAVTGEQASVMVEAGRLVSWQHESSPIPLPPEMPAPSAALGSQNLAVEAHRAQLQDVVDAIRVGGRPAVTGEDGRAALSLVLAAYESSRTRREIRLG